MDSLGSEQTDGIGKNDFFCWNNKGPWCSRKVEWWTDQYYQ